MWRFLAAILDSAILTGMLKFSVWHSTNSDSAGQKHTGTTKNILYIRKRTVWCYLVAILDSAILTGTLKI